MKNFNGILVYLAVALICVLASGRLLAQDLAQAPLFIEGNVPGNLALVPSVEYPTVISVANLGDYDPDKAYTGYFDSEKCYKYSYSYNNESERHFYPSSMAPNHTCSGSGEWSGNFLSWAATQTIDPFRLVLTGGHRAKDTPSETWLEKARHNRNDLYPDKQISGWNTVRGATPFDSENLTVRIAGQETEMLFSTDTGWGRDWDDDCNYGSYYDHCSAKRASVRVKVCDASVGLESFCKEYDDGWKPEGLIQQYAEDVKVSIFGYLNDDDANRDGGVLRANMKYVGPRKMTDNGWVVNDRREWDPDTGVLIRNPDGINGALGVSIDDSGVINYLNKFGQLNDNSFKSHDPVSELYYTAYRYFSNLGPVSAYTSTGWADDSTKRKWVDDFPVITDWDDPIEYSCQTNVILGIGDANTHRDKNLPGSSYRTNEPGKPGEVSSDNSVNVVTETNRVGQLEGIGNIGNSNDFSGRNNSAYIAGLAYRAHTRDIRPGDDDIAGIQTISTYWVDVLENQTLEGIATNQYYLAAKYGGFNFSDSFDPENPNAGLIELEHWSTNGETIYPGNQNNIEDWRTGEPRPDNYYLAGKAESMVSSLGKAFRSFVEHIRSSSSSVAANSTRLDTDSLIYQAIFNSNTWYGDLIAYGVDEYGNIDATPTWNAADRLDAISNERLVSNQEGSEVSPARRIYTLSPDTGNRIPFLWASLTDAQRTALNTDDNMGDDRVDYLRGDTRLERRNGGLFRNRLSRLGDIINSNPAYSGREGFGYQLLPNTAGEKYTSYLDEKRDRRAMIYVGANDGMLHGFDAETGRELFAYIPALMLDDLVDLTDPDYVHRYFVDGSPIVTDVYLGGEWKTVLIGTFGAGGTGLFALDISTPDDPEVLWEFSHAELGEGANEVSVIPVNDDATEWVVALGNGYNSASRRAALILIDMESGDMLNESPILVGPDPDEDEAGNGLAGITAISSSRGYIADTIYAGDVEGNLWKFELDGSDWEPAFGTELNPDPLFIAEDSDGKRQPITSRPEVTLTDDGRIVVLFGTGKYMELADIHDRSVQSAYGIIDEDQEVTRNDLVGQSITAQGSSVVGGESVPWREVTDNALGAASGWYLDLVPPGGSEEGERIVVRPVIRGEAVVLSTLIPSSTPCGGGGSSWIMAISKNNGGMIDGGVFDINGDGVIDENDYVNGGTVPAAGIGSSNIVSRLNFMTGPGGVDRGYASDTSGGIFDVPMKSFGEGSGRQSWRQLR